MNLPKILKIASSIFILVTLFIGVYLVGVKTGFINKASGVPADLVVDMGNIFINPGDCWRNLAQGGESKKRMLEPVIGDVKKLQPKYIRIDHIYDNYDVVSRDGAGNLNFNWSNLDQTVKDITAIGAIPFLSLSYMPPAISKDGKVESEPTNWSEWQYLVQKTVEHYSGPSGMNLQNVYYEVWNEPDLFGQFKAGYNKNYLDLYFYSQKGAISATNVKPFKIGGPATTGLYKNWMDSLVSYAEKGSVRLDFLSWHNYYADPDRYDSDVKSITTWLADHPNYKDIELIVSEMGINSKNDPAYDGKLSAIHTISAVTALQGSVSKCFNFEIIDGEGPEKLWGRWGLLTNEKFGTPTPKTRYHAMQFLNKMVGDRVSVNGNGTWVKAFTRHDGKSLRIMVSNFAPDGHSEVVPLKLINVPFASFTFKQTKFLGTTTPAQAVAADGGVWSTSLGMDPNTAVIVEIIPN